MFMSIFISHNLQNNTKKVKIYTAKKSILF